MNVINIRGTTGSGKTTIIHQLMKTDTFTTPITISEGVVGHFSKDICIIGPYKGGNFGGVDAIKKISYVKPAILKALEQRPTVIFEGLLISHSYERWLEFSKELKTMQEKAGVKPTGMIWAFITPPFRVNIRRLRKRNNIPSGETLRQVKGAKYISNFVSRYKSICRIRNKAALDAAFGHLTIRVLEWDEPFKDIQFLLKSDIMNTFVLKRTGFTFKHGVSYAGKR